MELEKQDFIIHPIPVLTDNIIWIWVKGDQAVVVDPAISQPVISWLEENELTLSSVLQTHHHQDHIGGTEDLLKIWPSSSIIAAKSDLDRIPFQTISVLDNDSFVLLEEEIKVLEVPGHTKNHVNYYLGGSKMSRMHPVLFSGDTLFGGGCGRLFEGTPNQMFNSLNRLKALPSETKIYCAHEYTEDNLKWAKSIYPDDPNISSRLEKVIKQRSKGLQSLPSTILEERKSNLFFLSKSSKEFAKLRLHKDNWTN